MKFLRKRAWNALEGIISCGNSTDIKGKLCDNSKIMNPHNRIRRSNTGKKTRTSPQTASSEHLAQCFDSLQASCEGKTCREV